MIKKNTKIFASMFLVASLIMPVCGAMAVDLGIYTVQPIYTDPSGETHYEELLPKVAQELANKFDNITYNFKSIDEDIFTAGIIPKMGPNQIILWQGHGDWDEFAEKDDQYPVLETGRDFKEERLMDPTYLDDYENKRIIKIAAGMGIYVEGIGPKYFDKYVSDLNGSLIYFEVCHSAHNDVLAKTLLNKGAAVVVASTLTLQMDYGNLIQVKVMELMGEINPATENYYTIDEALAAAKKEYGEKDPGSNGELVIFGDKNYRIAEVEKQEEIIPLAPDTGRL